MNNQDSWVDFVTPGLSDDIARISDAAYKNACDILDDAKILLRENRFARAGALVILAEEEFSKSFILIVCANQKRWDSEIFNALRKHPKKQSIAAAMREYFEWFVDNYNRVTKINRFSLIPATPAILPSPEQWQDMLAKAKNGIRQGKKEKYKQSLLYIGFNRAAHVISDPRDVDKKEVERCFKEAERFKEVVENALRGHTGIN